PSASASRAAAAIGSSKSSPVEPGSPRPLWRRAAPPPKSHRSWRRRSTIRGNLRQRVGMSGLRFEKYEGLGNDFVLVELHDETALGPGAARALCDRHYGIGADGVLLVLPASKGAAGRMLVLNADGSRPEMCGNGLRCVALHLHRRGAGEAFVVETDAGPRQCRMLGSNVEIGLGRGPRLPQHVADFDGAPVRF